MGLNASSDEWCRRSDVAVKGLEWCMKIVEDIIIWATNAEDIWSRINMVLDRCKAHNITIFRKKLEIGDEIEFAGHIISHRGIKLDSSKFQAIRDFPAPKNIKGRRPRKKNSSAQKMSSSQPRWYSLSTLDGPP